MNWQQTERGRVEHAYEPLVLALALLALPVVLIDVSHHTPDALRVFASVANWVIWIGFAVEYVAVLAVAPRREAALRAHVLDLALVLVTVPVLPTALGALRFARTLRILRLARIGFLGARALTAEKQLSSRQGFRYVAVATGMLVVVAGAAVSTVDSGDFPNPWRGMWWAIVTVTTVGYGDTVPHTVGGRIVACFVMVLGIGFLATLTAAIASRFVASDAPHDEVVDALQRIEARLAALEARLPS